MEGRPGEWRERRRFRRAAGQKRRAGGSRLSWLSRFEVRGRSKPGDVHGPVTRKTDVAVRGVYWMPPRPWEPQFRGAYEHDPQRTRRRRPRAATGRSGQATRRLSPAQEHRPGKDLGKRAARALALARQYKEDANAIFVDAAKCRGKRDAFTTVAIRASTGELLTASTVRTRAASRAEEVQFQQPSLPERPQSSATRRPPSATSTAAGVEDTAKIAETGTAPSGPP
ncbi:hypothetical protein HPB48_012862 [Haemaphysalis longicornis]|uniref:Uncharacterized protein n=1 Tax=Haemaphysalis longicornis TaxID=44386 RepID=A0A9J6GC55_HAELO|nr:hypothetical protein HPB48_012862 [Haemaphysalis longicornis]